MPRFSYTARDHSGQAVQSALEAPSRKEALRLLSARGLQPTVVEEAVAARVASSSSRTTTVKADLAPAVTRTGGRRAKKLSRRERLPFFEALYDLTSSGLSAGEAVRLLSVRLHEPLLRALCTGLWERLSEGSSLSRALSEFPEVFDASNVNLIQAGEATGSLNDVLARLIAHLNEQKELHRQLVAALAYPIFMLVVAVGVILFFLLFLLPRLQALLHSLGGDLPTSTKILVGLSDFSIHYGIFVAGAVVFAAISFWRWRQTPRGRESTDAWLLRLPLVGPFVVSQTVLVFSQTLSVLLENGITASEALRMTERQVVNTQHRRAFHGATDRVLEGEALSVALERTGCFPGLALDQLAVGENTGNVVPSLKKIASTYQKTLTNQLSAFTRVLASAVLLSVFIFVGFIAFAIVSAVFQLSASFQM